MATMLTILPGEKFSPDPSYEQQGIPNAYCSVGPIGWDRSGRLVMITAGHATRYKRADGSVHLYEPGAPVYLHKAPDTPVGYVTDVRDMKVDYAVIELDPAVVIPSSLTLNGMHFDHVGAQPQPWRQVVVKDGASTGKTSGLVTSNDGRFISTFQWIWAGDSGGPLLDTRSGMVGFTISTSIGDGLTGMSKFVNLRYAMRLIDAHGPDAVGSGFRIRP